MVVSGWLIKIPYWLCWHVRRVFGLLDETVFYLDYAHDYFIIEHLLPHLNFPYRLVARNRRLAQNLRARGVEAGVWPAFPRRLILTRHAFHRFPLRAIKKVGLKHGPWFFKKMIRPGKFNAFDLFVFISESEVKLARQAGVTAGVAGGYPRLDAFSDPQIMAKSQAIRQQPGFDAAKKTLLFTTTWDGSGMSAAHRWFNELHSLTEKFNILLSLHPMMSEGMKEKARSIPGVFLAGPEELPAQMLAADMLVGDTSSVLAEFCALEKPIITFTVDKGARLTPEIRTMIADISLQIENTVEIPMAVEQYEKNPSLKQAQRQHWTGIFFDDVNVSHGQKAAAVLNDWVRYNT